MEEVKELKRWLSKGGNSTAKMAFALGYKSSSTVSQWIKRGNIPAHQRDRVMKFIKRRK